LSFFKRRQFVCPNCYFETPSYTSVAPPTRRLPFLLTGCLSYAPIASPEGGFLIPTSRSPIPTRGFSISKGGSSVPNNRSPVPTRDFPFLPANTGRCPVLLHNRPSADPQEPNSPSLTFPSSHLPIFSQSPPFLPANTGRCPVLLHNRPSADTRSRTLQVSPSHLPIFSQSPPLRVPKSPCPPVSHSAPFHCFTSSTSGLALLRVTR
jgi:hypothetical protein